MLKQSLKATNFKSLSLNECARCADGTDYKITLIESGKKYENTIAKRSFTEDLKPDQIKLQELLSVIEKF